MSAIPSVVIRNRNEAEHLIKVLRALSVQTVEHQVVLVDNESTDDSVSIAQSFGAAIVPLKNFTYGRGLNVGIREARGDVCVILSAHSVPLGRRFIEACVEPFGDSKVAAVRCVYVGKSSDALRWIEPETLDRTATLNDVISRGPLASGCAIRRSVWQNIPFDETVAAAEDKLWARDVLSAGYTILSPCDAFYQYIKPVSPTTGLRYNDRDLRAVFHATGVRLGAAKKPLWATLTRAFGTALTDAPRAALAIVRREMTRAQLRLQFPNHAQHHQNDGEEECSK